MSYNKEHYEANKDKYKAYYEANKDRIKVYKKEHRERQKATRKLWYQTHKEQYKEYNKADLNSLGQTKQYIRKKSQRYLSKYGTKLPGYQIHHCCTYDEPYKFIYCNKEMHYLIHSYLRQHNIDADSDHYKYIKHLLDDSVIVYGI